MIAASAALLVAAISGSIAACGGSTRASDGACEPVDLCTGAPSGPTVPRCGEGTHLERDLCVADARDGAAPCGSGTEWVGGQCVASPHCGPGTHSELGTCVPDPTPPPADDGGVTVACGDGTHIDRGGCVPDDPATALGSSTPCLGGGNRLAVYGDPDSFVYPGAHTIIGGTWANGMQGGEPPDGVLLEAHLPGSISTDPWWFLFFETLHAAPAKGIYAFDGTSAGSAGFQLQWGSSGCPSGASGAFQIEDIAYHGSVLDSFTVTFWQHCPEHTGLTRGCAHVGP
jgi:hypothetical protein